jgi:hypothetical protein
MEEPYGVFGTLNPTGHTAIYFSHICAETPVKLRRCEPGEMGSVIARYQGINGFDWVAMPLIPYLYSVDDVADVPQRVNRETVTRLRRQYREEQLTSLGKPLYEGDFFRGGWTQLVGVAYERRTYAFRFATTEEQDDELMAELNDRTNRSSFNLLFNNCADFARKLMNFYYPHTFNRTLVPDAFMTTPRQIAFRLARYAMKHPEIQLAVFEIPQVPGYRRQSRTNKSVSASLITTGYAIPIAMLNPYIAGGIFIDYLIRGRFPRSIPDHPELLEPEQLSVLTGTVPAQIRIDEDAETGVAVQPSTASPPSPGLKAIADPHE